MTPTPRTEAMMELGAMQGPAVPRDEAAIDAKRAYAITMTDDFLRAILTGNEYQLPEPVRRKARECRGLLAEWCQESD